MARLALALLAALPLACRSNELDPELRQFATTSTFAPGAAIPRGPSFAWFPTSGLRPDPSIDTRKIEALLREAIIEALEARGWRHTGAASAQLFIGYGGALNTNVHTDELAQRYELSGGWTPASSTEHRAGTLVVDIADRRTRRAMWRGSGEGRVSPELPDEKRRERAKLAVAALFQTLP